MKNYLFLTIMFVVLTTGFSQEFQGKAIYESKTQVNMDFGNRQMSEERKKMIKERMRQANEKTFILTFSKSESIYEEEEKLDQPGGRGGMRWGRMNAAGGDLYKNIVEEKYLSKIELMGKLFLVEDKLNKIEWHLDSETKRIGNYDAFKATATKVIKRPNMRAIFNRNGDDKKGEEFVEKEVQVVAWYAPEVPINQGPGKYFGLPGLILEVSDDITTIICSKIVMNPKDKITIKAPTKGKKVTQEEYDKIAKEKMLQMRENFRNNGNRGGSRF